MSPNASAPRPSIPEAETVTVAPVAAPAEALTLAPTPLAENDNGSAFIVPDYEILGELGRGGMGVVYKARQIAADRIVALKMILSGGHASAADLARFRSEGQAVARLQHPGIVQVFDVGEHQGLPFFSLEFVDGGSLDKKLNGTPLPPREAARLIEQVAEAMHAAHRQHIVHRDLKPANILLTSEGQPKVTDFGLAKTLDVEQGHTATGAIMGTPSYMAPEQASGKSKEIGPATDVYALGAVLYECLTGRPPFRAATPLDTILQALSDEPVPPSQLQPKVPRDVETICLKCLRKEPNKRYASAAELAEDLRRFREGEPIRARPVGAAERAFKWVRRRPALAALMAVVLLAALGLTGGGIWFTLRLDEARRRAEDNAAAEGKARAEAAAQKEKADAARQDALKQLDRAEQGLYVNLIDRADRETEAHDLQRSNDFLDQCRRDDRNWEWHHLRYRNHYTFPLQTLQGHTDVVSTLVFSPDGSRFASASGDMRNRGQLLRTPGEVKLWDARTGAAMFSLKGHTAGVVCLSFSADGSRLASGSGDKTVKVWDTRTGAEVYSLEGHIDIVYSVALSPDGTRLASSSVVPGKQGEVKLWDASTGREVRSFPMFGVLAFSPDGRRLAVAWGSTVKVLEIRTGAELFSLEAPTRTDWLGSVAFSIDGSRLARMTGQEVYMWDARTGARVVSRPLPHADPSSRGAFSPDLGRLADVSLDLRVKVWDTRTGAELTSLQEGRHPALVFSLAFSPDGRRLASADLEKTVKLWDARTGTEALNLGEPAGFVDSVAFTPDGLRLVSGGAASLPTGPGEVKVWDVRTGVEIRSLKGHSRLVTSVAVSPDGTRLASASYDGTARVWDTATGGEIFAIKGVPVGTRSLCFSPDGRRLAGVCVSTVKVWDAATGRETLAVRHDFGGCVVFSPDGRRLAVGSNGPHTGEVKVWDAATGRELRTLRRHTGPVLGVAFSPDGRRLASAGDTVRVWNAPTSAEVLPPKSQGNSITSLAFNPADRARRQRDENWTTIAWHLQQADRSREARDPFATRFHRGHALVELRAQVFARLSDSDASGCRHACTLLAAVAGRSDESIQQFREMLGRCDRLNPAADELLLAMAYHKRGQLAEARRWLNRAILSIERPGLRETTALLGGASAGALPVLSLLPDLRATPNDGPTGRALPSLRQETETLLKPGKP